MIPVALGQGNNPSDFLFKYAQPSLAIGNNIVAFLDTLSGLLSLYSLANNVWSVGLDPQTNLPNIKITPPSELIESFDSIYSFYSLKYLSGMSVIGDDVFVLSNETSYGPSGNLIQYDTYPEQCQTFYQLWHYDVTAQSKPNQAWSNPISLTQWVPNDIIRESLTGTSQNPSGTYVAGFELIPGSGYLNVQAILVNNPPPLPVDTRVLQQTKVGRPFVVSWDEEYGQISIQRIFSRNNAPVDQMFWGTVLEGSRFAWPSDEFLNGTVAISNLINIATNRPYALPDASQHANEVRKYITRYVAGQNHGDNGGQDGAPVRNIGWVCDSGLSNDTIHQLNPWEQMATLDTTVGVETIDITTYQCRFYQFNPYAGGAGNPHPDGPGWDYQSNVMMGNRTDWTEVQNIIDEVLSIVGLVLTILTLPLTGGASLIEEFIPALLIRGVSLLDFIVNGPQSLAYGFIESAIFSALLSNKRSGDIGIGSTYLMVGTPDINDAQPTVYYRSWNRTAAMWQWNSLTLPLPAQGELGPNQEVYQYGASFIPFPYQVNSQSADQVACLRNRQVATLLPMPQGYALFQDPSANKLNYMAPWGGLLTYNVSTSETSPTLKLLMVRDEQLEGRLSDYVVDRVSVDDGYQVYDTCMKYLGQNAIYNAALGSVAYNQTRIAEGAPDYIAAIGLNGWTELYTYNGAPTPFLPYDPATDAHAILHQLENFPLTNANLMPNLLFGQTYATRVLKDNSQVGHPGTGAGIEMSRSVMYYIGYNQSLVNNVTTDTPKTAISYNPNILNESTVPDNPQQTTGFVQTLTASMTAPDDTTYTSLLAAYNQAVYTTTTSFYDLSTLHGNELLSGSLINSPVFFQTGLPLSTQTLSYHYVSPTSDPVNQYTEQATQYAFERPEYNSQFVPLNLWGPVTQVTLSQTSDVQSGTFSSHTLNPLSSQVITYQKASSSLGSTYFYPYGSYRWIGTGNGEAPTNSINFSPTQTSQLAPSALDWQLASYTREIQDGVVQNAVTVLEKGDSTFQGPRATMLYDTTQTLVVASVTSPNANATTDVSNPIAAEIADSMVRFFSFEPYEDLSGWGTFSPATNKITALNPALGTGGDTTGTILQYATTASCYAGEACLNLTPSLPQAGIIPVWGGHPIPATLDAADNLVLSFFCAPNATNVKSLQIWLFAKQSDGTVINLNGTGNFLGSVTMGVQANFWRYENFQIPLHRLAPLFDVTPPYTLYIGFSADPTDDAGNAIYVDAVSLTPPAAQGRFTVYNLYGASDPRRSQSTRLPVATIDINGLTVRMAYDARRRLIGTAQGQGQDQQTLSVPLLSFAREQGAPNMFNNQAHPNMQGMLSASNGGNYFDFRTAGDTMGWQALSGSIEVPEFPGVLQFSTSTIARFNMQPCTFGAGFRVQWVPTSQETPTSSLSMRMINSSNATVTWTPATNTYHLSVAGSTPVPLSAVGSFESDWLLLMFENAVYFYAGGAPIFQYAPVGLSVNFNAVQVALQTTDLTINVSNIVCLQDPRMSVSLQDGRGASRQTQVLSDIGPQQ